jgi:tetratricopeptide (TPR) repeat protein
MAQVTTTDFIEALRARDRDQVNRTAERLLDQPAALRGEWFDVAKVLAANMEVTLAVKAAQRGVEELGDSASARFRFADLLATVGRQSEALDVLAEVSTAIPNALELDQFVGTCAMEIGAIDLAREALDRVVHTWPGAGAAWLSLAALPPTDDGLLLGRLLDARGLVKAARASDRAQWHYAIGSVLDRTGEPDDAFAEFAAGAAIVAKHRPYDLDNDREDAGRIITEFDAETIARIADRTAGPARAIFVIGLPRSGTTLVEHIISGHSEVAGGEELPFGVLIAHEAGGNSSSALEAPAGKRTADRLADLYHHFGRERFGSDQRFVDKSVDNSRTIGLLAAILPDAPIVWLRRDPLNAAWSCLRTYFSDGVEWSWSLTDIAAHFEAEDRLYAHWREVLGDRMLTVTYEELVTDTAAIANRLFEHVGLEPEAHAPPTHELERTVSTASMMQVRQPIYQSSINAADRYRDYLQPFVDAYRPAGGPKPRPDSERPRS